MKQPIDLFPHEGFPIRLEYQDGDDHRVCWFQSQWQLDKHLTRHKLKLTEVKLDYRDFAREKTLTKAKTQDSVPVKKEKKPKLPKFSSLNEFFDSPNP